ncbi:MAG: trimethylamine methyltransferase family protein [Pseudomonadota bacterium]
MRKPSAPPSRRGRRARRDGEAVAVITPGEVGGAFNPLADHEVGEVHAAVLDVLAIIGLGDAPEEISRPVCARGGTLTEGGRLLFPHALVEDVIAAAAQPVTLYGRHRAADLVLSPGRVYCGPGGAAPEVLDRRTHPATNSIRGIWQPELRRPTLQSF